MVQQRVDIRKTLIDKELGSKLTYLETLQQLVEQQQELAGPEEPAAGSRGGGGGDRRDARQAEAEYRRTLLDELAKAEQKAAGSPRT